MKKHKFAVGDYVVIDRSVEININDGAYVKSLGLTPHRVQRLADLTDCLWVNGSEEAYDQARFKLYVPDAPTVKSNGAKIAIYDRVNTSRLLGYLNERPVSSLRGRYVQVVTAPRMASVVNYVNDFITDDLHVSRITFDIGFELSADGYTQNAVFRTDAKLDTLMDLRTFMLPGENYDTAKRRRYMRGYGG